MADLYSESDLDMTEVWPPVPTTTCEAPAVEPGAGTGGGGAEGNPPTPSVSLGRDDFGGIHESSSSSSDGIHTSNDSSNSNDSGDLPALVGRLARDLEVFGELPALQSGCTRSHSRGLIMNTYCVDALLTYTMRTVEGRRIVEE